MGLPYANRDRIRANKPKLCCPYVLDCTFSTIKLHQKMQGQIQRVGGGGSVCVCVCVGGGEVSFDSKCHFHKLFILRSFG